MQTHSNTRSAWIVVHARQANREGSNKRKESTLYRWLRSQHQHRSNRVVYSTISLCRVLFAFPLSQRPRRSKEESTRAILHWSHNRNELSSSKQQASTHCSKNHRCTQPSLRRSQYYEYLLQPISFLFQVSFCTSVVPLHTKVQCIRYSCLSFSQQSLQWTTIRPILLSRRRHRLLIHSTIQRLIWIPITPCPSP